MTFRFIGFAPRLIAGIVFAVLLCATDAARADGVVFTASGHAIRGFDPVAYFTEGKAVEGKDDFVHDWSGVTWRFASAANRDRFAAAPDSYAPQYGGYCAWAVSKGYTAPTDPDAWKIVAGKLYLNYSKGVQSQWVAAGPEKLIALGDPNWPAIKADLKN